MARAEETLAGRYEVLNVLGRGGMGVVYRARDRVLDRIVAVKVLPAALAEVNTLAERFEREAKAAARLNHPNIVAVFDTGTDRGARYIVMECVPGESLADRLRHCGRLAPAEAIEIAAQIASALAAAHAAGITHRDIKPGNVMVQPSGAVKVLDFGIARLATDVALTSTTTLLGSAPYMAPEVALGERADARSDIYSLGCVLYEMLAGRPPFIGESSVAVMNQHASAKPPPLSEFDPAIPTEVEAMVMQLLAKRPEDRPQDASSLVSALRASLRAAAPEQEASTVPLQRPLPSETVEPPPEAGEPRPAPSLRESAPPPAARPSRRSILVLLAVAIALLAGAAIAVAIAGSSKSGHPTSTGSSNGAPATGASSGPTSTTRRSTATSPSSTSQTATSSPTATTTATTPTTSTSVTSTTGTSGTSGTSNTSPPGPTNR